MVYCPWLPPRGIIGQNHRMHKNATDLPDFMGKATLGGEGRGEGVNAEVYQPLTPTLSRFEVREREPT